MTDTETQRLPLLKPIAVGDQTIDALDLREPTGAEMEKAAATTNPVTSNLILISEVTKVPLAVARRLCKRDYDTAVNILNGTPADAEPAAVPAAAPDAPPD